MPAVSAEYMKDYRKRHPEFVTRANQYGAARSRALTRLGALYPNVYARLLEEELGRRPAKPGRPRRS